jgi:transcriptional regulator with XRE-family HTH domain
MTDQCEAYSAASAGGSGRKALDTESNSRARLLGERFERERQRRGLTLEDVFSFTRVQPRFLSAIEQGNFGQLPGGILSKGFIRAYAQCIAIDENEAIAEYLQTGALHEPLLVVDDSNDHSIGAQSSKGPANRLKPRGACIGSLARLARTFYGPL